jgi:plasmid stability protein
MGMIQVRDVPSALHEELRRRAKKRGQTLTDYIQAILEREVSRPDATEVFERIEADPPLGKLPKPASWYVHRARREAGRE